MEFLLLAATCCLRLLAARPIVHQHDSAIMTGAMNFLTKYGYLPPMDLNAGNLLAAERLKYAIRAMQRYAGIFETGVIDEMTINVMKRGRCGIPDVVGTSGRDRRYALQGGKWNRFNLTWNILDRLTKLDHRTIRREISRASNVWREASPLTFTEISQGDQADISISFYRGYHDDGYPFDGLGSVLAHAFFPGRGLGGDIHFDSQEEWDTTNHEDSVGVSLFAVAAHEFGHSLGFLHSSHNLSLMFPYYQWIQADYVLPEDDRMGLKQLYGSSHKEWAPLPPMYTRPSFIPTFVPTESPPSPPTTASSNDDDMPNTCETSYDAVSMIRGELFIFKDTYFWRLDTHGVQKGYPTEIKRFWYYLPEDFKRVDAVYERPHDKKILMFIGKQYWLFNANNLPVPDFPKPLSELGFPANLSKIDAALVWGLNGRTYFFSGRQYWRFDEHTEAMEFNYPRDMRSWRKVPYNINAAFQWTNKKTYFFKKNRYWEFNDKFMIVKKNKNGSLNGSLSAQFWMQCPRNHIK